MAIFPCRSFKQGFRKATLNKISLQRFRGASSKKIALLFYKCLSRRSGVRKSNQFAKSKVFAVRRGKLVFNFARHPSRSFIGSKFKFLVDKRVYDVISFQESNFKSRLSIAQTYEVFSFKNGSTLKNLKLALSYNSSHINQDSNYFILSKLELSSFGLILKEDNSVEELLMALLLFWRINLESSRVNVVFYRYLRFQEKLQWVEGEFILVNVLVLNSKEKKFPSPVSLSI
jgi:hypothetical protein